jgi:hypothetical protein
MLFLNI